MSSFYPEPGRKNEESIGREKNTFKVAKSINHFLNFLRKRKGSVVRAYVPLESFGVASDLPSFVSSVPEDILWHHPHGGQGGRVPQDKWHATLLLKMNEDPNGCVKSVQRLIGILQKFNYSAPLDSFDNHRKDQKPNVMEEEVFVEEKSSVQEEFDEGVHIKLVTLSTSHPVDRLKRSFGADVAVTVAALQSPQMMLIKECWLTNLNARQRDVHDPYGREGHISLTYTHGKYFSLLEEIANSFNVLHSCVHSELLVPEIRIEAKSGRYSKTLKLTYSLPSK